MSAAVLVFIHLLGPVDASTLLFQIAADTAQTRMDAEAPAASEEVRTH